jgi:hypothetical protein
MRNIVPIELTSAFESTPKMYVDCCMYTRRGGGVSFLTFTVTYIQEMHFYWHIQIILLSSLSMAGAQGLLIHSAFTTLVGS